MIGCFVGAQPRRKFVAHTVVRSRKIILGCWVRNLRLGLFVHGGEGGSTHCFGWLADWSVQLQSHSESSCGLYSFPTFTCAWPSKRSKWIYTTRVWPRLPYIYDLHFQALWPSDSENYINSSSYKHWERVCVCLTNWLSCLYNKSVQFQLMHYDYALYRQTTHLD